jgi:hypothetical protein
MKKGIETNRLDVGISDEEGLLSAIFGHNHADKEMATASIRLSLYGQGIRGTLYAHARIWTTLTANDMEDEGVRPLA